MPYIPGIDLLRPSFTNSMNDNPTELNPAELNTLPCDISAACRSSHCNSFFLFLFLFFFFPSHLLFSLFYPLSLLVVAQIRGHISSSSLVD